MLGTHDVGIATGRTKRTRYSQRWECPPHLPCTSRLAIICLHAAGHHLRSSELSLPKEPFGETAIASCVAAFINLVLDPILVFPIGL
jgi:hypothetical protein